MCLGAKDLEPRPIPRETLEKLERDSIDTGALSEVFDWLVVIYVDTFRWYMSRRRKYRLWAGLFRLVAIVGFVSTILWPPIQLVGWAEPIAMTFGLAKDHVSQFGYLLAAIGGAAMTIDKMAGMSSAWTRTGGTAMKLLQAHDDMQMRWATVGGEKVADKEDLLWLRIGILRDGIRRIWELLGAETAEWSKSYSADLKQLDGKLSDAQGKKP